MAAQQKSRLDKRFIAIFSVVFIDLVGFGIAIPILLLHAEESFGASDIQATLLLSVYSAGIVIAGPILGRLSDAFGRRPVLIASQIGTLIGFIVLGFADSLWLLYLGRIIDGVSGGNISTAQAYINDITTEENRAQGFGVVSAAFSAGFIIGPALGGLVAGTVADIPSIADYSQQAPFFVAALFSIGSILGTYFILPESLPVEERSPLRKDSSVPEAINKDKTSLLDVLLIPQVRYILTFTLITFLSFSLLQSSFALVTRRNIFPGLQLEDAQQNIGLFLGEIGTIGVLMQIFMVGRLVKWFGERRLVVGATFVRILSFLGVTLAATPLGLGLSLAPLALGNAVSQPSLQSIISRFSPPHMRGRVLGAFQSVNSITLIIGPILSGIIFELNYGDLPAHLVNAMPMAVATVLMTVALIVGWGIVRLELPSQEKSGVLFKPTLSD